MSLRTNGVDSGPVDVWLEGEYLDALLSQSRLQAKSGSAFVTLRAPTENTLFAVKAKFGNGPPARLDVVVGATGFTTLTVRPIYEGKRLASGVVASIAVGKSCQTIAKAGTLETSLATTSSYVAPIALTNVPLGISMSLLLRYGSVAFGCVGVQELKGPLAETIDVKLLDLPLRLDGVRANFLIDPLRSQNWYTTVSQTKASVVSLLPNGNDTSALLGAMKVASGFAIEFEQNRGARGWDNLTSNQFASRNFSFRGVVSRWFDALQENDISSFSIAIDADPASGGITTPSAFANGLATEVEMSLPSPPAWSTDGSDGVYVAGPIRVNLGKAVYASALPIVKKEAPLATSTVNGMSIVAGCASLGTQMAVGGPIYPGCDATCAAKLCEDAIQSIVSASTLGTYFSSNISGSGTCIVKDVAIASNCDGAWLGSVGGVTPFRGWLKTETK
ncbi:MAG: hypothetical protein KBF88_09895 [Polyangiaceae bacterium]|nr:hypothetical protein [Polyangiaceae bacterium]